MIGKRIFYFLFYISFIYRSTFVLSDSTTAVPVETDGSVVDPNASQVVTGAGASLVSPDATTISPSIADGFSTSTSVDTSSTLDGSHVVTSPAFPGSPSTGAPLTHSVALPPAQDSNAGAPLTIASSIAGAPVAMSSPAAGTPVAMAPPSAGSQPVASHVAPGNQAMAAPTMPGSHVVTTPASPGSQPVASHVASATQAFAAPMMPGSHVVTTPASPGSQPETSPVYHGAHVATPATPGTQSMVSSINYGDQTIAAPMMPGSHVVTTPASPGSQPVASHVASASQAFAAPMMPGSHVVTTPASPGVPIAGAPLTHSVAVPAAQGSIAGAPITHSVALPAAQEPTAGAPLAMTPPSAGSQVATSITPGSQVLDTSMTFVAPDTTGTQPETSPVYHGAQVATPAAPGTQSMVSSINYGDQTITAPTMTGSHVVTTPATPGAPIATISLDGNPSSDSTKQQITLIQIEINYKQDTDYIKYRRIEDKGMDIFYAKDGFLINEICLSGKKRWPPDGEDKQCKKVLFIINPSDGKKTLRVLYPDEDEAYDPDNPPQKTSDLNQGMTQPSQGGTTTPLLSESTASYNEADVSSLYSPLASVSGSTVTIPRLEDVLSATDPNAITSVPHQDYYKTDDNGQVYLEITVAKGQESSDLASGSHGTDSFTVEEIHPPKHGRTIEYEDSDDEFTPDDDDTPVDLTTYVTRVGRRVEQLETRMDSAETTIRLLTRTLEYQHEILDFRRRFGVKTAPFGADMGRHAFFDPAAFRPATSQVSKVLDATELPSDIKLFVLDVNDHSKYVELPLEKYEVKQEGDEIQYVFEPSVECKLVTFKDRTVWNHRSTDPHPNGVVFHPVDDKVVVDFDDAIVMYVKKGELDGDDVSSGHPAKKSILDIPLGKIESDDESGHHKASERENGTEVAANATSNGGVIGNVTEAVPYDGSNVAQNDTTKLATDSSSVLSEPSQTASVPAESAQTSTVPESSAQTASVSVDPDQTTTVPAGSPESTPVTHNPAVPAASPESSPVTHTPAVPAGSTVDHTGTSASTAQDPNEGAPTV